MRSAADHATHNPAKNYCLHCCRDDGSMKSQHEVEAGMKAFLIKTQGLDDATALQAAQTMMTHLPAWRKS